MSDAFPIESASQISDELNLAGVAELLADADGEFEFEKLSDCEKLELAVALAVEDIDTLPLAESDDDAEGLELLDADEVADSDADSLS